VQNKLERKKELETQLNVIREELSQITDELTLEDHKKLIGKCFRYANSVSSTPEWWYYYKIVGIGRFNGFDIVSFEIDCDGKAAVDPNGDFHSNSSEEISTKDFNKAWEQFKHHVESIEEKLK
jgi:hypothetical protein